MPKLLVMVPETQESIVRPVAYKIARDVMALTGLSNGVDILLNHDEENGPQLGSRLNTDKEKNKFSGTNRIILTVSENYVAEQLLTAAVFKPEHRFIFKDESLNTYIKPVFSHTDVTLNFKVRVSSQTAAKRWRDDIRARIGMSRDIQLHRVDYQYLLPNEINQLLTMIHGLRETIAPYGETLSQFMQKHLVPDATVVTDLAGRNENWAIDEGQTNIHGWFDFSPTPEKEQKENEQGAWSVSFDYRFKFDKVIGIVMGYPIMVHNQLIPKKYLTQRPATFNTAPNTERSLTMSAYQPFEKKLIRDPMEGFSGLSIPAIDDFIPGNILPKTIRIATALVAISENDRRSLMNLGQLGKWEFIPELLAFLKSEAKYMVKPYDSIFTVTLYKGIDSLHYEYLSVDSDLNVRATKDLSLRDYYHVRLGLVTDLSYLSKDALKRLQNNGPILQFLLNAIDPRLNGRPALVDGHFVKTSELQDVMGILNNNPLALDGSLAIRMKTVETFYIEAYRKKDL